ncbi:hypothetical protein K504DRAFT_537914 [Pleomassaria siparia CBS 279.74]|uniref:Zn(2)-C6 fungal-type domain-containing protein n=1 Tax=Pleomassaria siparia CBS 279.74 TaxID=1314801 RepID=A0A6G1JV84_9PLEO|nr:hypothetical protein K504DRAFT_537914 [Pleomassaria siparia CBS 279.74]
MFAEPSSRRKSCGECVKAKRKCGMELPKCKRCQKKNIACGYPNNRASVHETVIPDLEFPWLDDLMRDSNILPWTGVLQPQLEMLSGTPQQNLAPYQNIPEYLIATDTQGTARSTMARAETEAALHRFKTWPDKWLKEGKAPFIHPRLYISGMPKPLQEAYAACAIYSTMTVDNSFIAFTVIETKANDLLQSPNQPSWTPLDLLAAIQSLLIFQFIRLFDGDIRQRALAEKSEPMLASWTEELKSRTQEEQQYTTFTAPSWRSWIFAESVRRTITMSIFLTGIYSLVKHGYCTSADAITANSFTAQRRFWDTNSALEWERARQTYPSYWVDKMNFDHILQHGKGTEIEDFGLVMMIMYKGQDTVDHWLAVSNAERSFVIDPHFQQTLQGELRMGDGSMSSSELI